MTRPWTEYYYVCKGCDASITIVTNKVPRHRARCMCSMSTAWVFLISSKELEEVK